MRPIRLKMEAFGAYVKPLDLDFSLALGDGNFFLIHGATGSGKTTILDAICFALYGASSGGGRDGSMFRSEHATEKQPTYVEFTFALKEQTYFIRRALKRGKIDAELKVDDALISTGAKNVTARIEELIGFKSDQFRQVVVLPQGDFKRFLLAGSKERETILTILFKTEMYRRIEQALKDRAAELRRRFEAKDQLRRDLLSTAGATDESELTRIIVELERELVSTEESIRRLKLERDAANKNLSAARALSDQFIELDRRNAELQSATASLERVRSQTSAAREEFERHRAEEAERRQLDQKIVELTAALRKLDELRQTLSQSATASKAVAEAEIELSKAKRTVELYEERLQFRLDEEKKLLANSGKVSAARLLLDQCLARDKSLESIARLEKDAMRATTEVQRFERERSARRTKLERLKELARSGRAARLAADLIEGEPCPVCGSTHHPRLATSDEIIPSDEELELAERSLRSIEDQKSAADKKLAALTAELESRRADSEKFSTLMPTVEAKDQLARAQRAEDELKLCRERIEKGRQLVEEVKLDLDRKQRALTEASSRRASALASVEEKRNSLPPGFNVDDQARLSAEIDSLRSKLEKLTRAFEAADRNFHRLERESARAAAALESIEKLRAELIDRLKDHSRPELSSLENIFKRAQQAHDDETGKAARLSERRRMLDERQKKLSALATELVELERRYKVWARLSTVANGKISFSRYVLHAMFEDIIAEANQRLAVMSERRYLLVDRKDAADARKLSGLELEIYDEYTESKRDVRTLSGGESFLASLSLALGLADVVQNYSGGVKLDTIFIDEGFGTLDNETLDMAIRSLTELQKDGRLVGIISHVEELRRRIPLRLEVKKSRHGSDAYFTRR